MTAHAARLSFDFRSREQVEQFVDLNSPEVSVFIPTLDEVTLGKWVELDLGLTGQRGRYQLEGKVRWFRRGGSGPRLLPGVSLTCDAVAALTLQQLAHDARFHSFLFTRAHPRLPCGANVRVHLRAKPKGSAPVVAHLGDISRGGAFVAMSAFPPVIGNPDAPPVLIEFAIDKPERQRPVVAASVRWLGFLNGEKGFGVQFVDPDSRVRKEIERLLALAAGR